MRTDYIMDQEVQNVLSLLTEGNRLAISVALRTGLRIGDVLALPRDKIGTHFWVTESKTGKRRQVGLPQSLVDEIMAHSFGSEWAFPGRKKGKPRTRQAVWRDVKRAAEAYRIDANVAPHSFRKVYAVELLNKYGDLERVQRALNHSSPTVTLIYAMADKRIRTRNSRKSASGKALR